MSETYQLIDSGHGRKLERFGNYILSRPCSQAVWKPSLKEEAWKRADAFFTRENDTKWQQHSLAGDWSITVADIRFKISPTDFGHLGIFPEQKPFWEWIPKILKNNSRQERRLNVLNLFAYSGGSTLAAAKGGASVCHLDASKGMVAWAKENALLNKMENAPIRWIVDDVKKFLGREIRRGVRYDGIILDPPSFGRGAKGEIFKIEEDIIPLLQECRLLLAEDPLFVLFSCHTAGFTPLVMKNLTVQMMDGIEGVIETREMSLEGNHQCLSIPSGTYAKWTSRHAK